MITDDRKTIFESLSEATVSGNLSQSDEHLTDVDYIGALGIAGQRSRVGHALLRIELTQDRNDIPQAMRATMDLVASLAKQRGWPMHALRRRKIAMAVLTLFLSPACPACKGRGMIGVDRDNPDEYRPRPCTHCGGSGNRPIQRQYQREIREVLHILNARRTEIGGIVRKALGSRARVE